MSTSNRLAAALAYRPETAYCPDCQQRKPYAEMRNNYRICKHCWATYCKTHRPKVKAARALTSKQRRAA